MPTAAEVSELQIYSGYEVKDVEALRAFATEKVVKNADHYLDGFGVKTLYECVPFFPPASLNVQRVALPVPDDGYHAEAIEYIAVTDNVRRHAKDRYCAVELGAGWGPWIGLAGVLAKKRKVKDIVLVGVEASPERYALMGKHMVANDLRPAGVTTEDATQTVNFGVFSSKGTIRTRLFNGAIWTSDGVVYFPETEKTDMGAAASETGADYRGPEIPQRAVPSRTLPTLLGDLGPVDLIHIDVQGSEADLLAHDIDWVTKNVRALLIGTHTRSIEGRLIDLLFAHGWELHREKPCRVAWTHPAPIQVRTTHDGSQYWLNPALA